MAEFATANDLTKSIVIQYAGTPVGAKTIANWASQNGYLIKYWCFEPYKSSGVTLFIGFGLDVDEACPKITELKLKA